MAITRASPYLHPSVDSCVHHSKYIPRTLTLRAPTHGGDGHRTCISGLTFPNLFFACLQTSLQVGLDPVGIKNILPTIKNIRPTIKNIRPTFANVFGRVGSQGSDGFSGRLEEQWEPLRG
eukprot:217190-Prorocentrum_minimum.AAC.1